MAARFRRRLRNNAWTQVGVCFALAIAALPVSAQQPRYANKLAPYVVSPQFVVERMLELADVKPGEMVYDLGCGDGRVLITAVQQFNARAVGYEISDKLVASANDRITRLGLQNKIRIIHGDLMKADLSGADVVTIYLLTLANNMLRPHLEKELRAGARVVSYSFPVPGWKPQRVDKTDEHDGHSIYLYVMPPERSNGAVR
jgi:protein-L-isoaspartate O-methyltransferase